MNGHPALSVDRLLVDRLPTKTLRKNETEADHSLRGRRSSSRVRRSREGKIAIVVGVTLMMMVALAAVLGNTGHVIREKMEVQNAADATALAAAEQMARGMNALTATNHILGEMTALVVTLEAFGGPEVDAGIRGNPPQTDAIDGVIRSIGSKAAITGLPVWVPPPVHNADRLFVDQVVNLMVGKSGKKKEHAAFATIFDAKTTLKRQMVKRQLIKTVANGALMIPPPWGGFVAPVAYAAHGHSSYEMLQIGKEWLILEAMEKMVTAGPIKKLKGLVETKIVPALVKHGDMVAGYDSKRGKRPGSGGTGNSNQTGGAKKSKQDGGIVSKTVAAAKKQTGERLKSVTYLSPHSNNLRMPVIAEPEPSLRGLAPGESWGEEPTLASVITPMDILKMQQDLEDAQDELDDQEDNLELDLVRLDQAERLVRLRLASDDLDETKIREKAEGANTTEQQQQELEEKVAEAAEEKEALADELEAIALSRRLRQDALKKVQEGQASLAKERPAMEKAMAELLKLPQDGGNPSPKNLPKKLTIGEERYTQWVRASYPYVDAIRAGMLTTMKAHMKRSKTADHFTKWSDRYTLVKAWQFRSGQRFKKGGGKLQGTWAKDTKVDPMSVYVMKGMYRKASQQGGRSKTAAWKGYETWTGESTKARSEAEKMFVLAAVAHRDFEPSFNSNVFPAGSDSGLSAIAQSILYNASEQNPTAPSDENKLQPKVGWDTLNWAAGSSAPEWGSEPSNTGKKIWPWQLFDAMKDQDTIQVHLNWQAKLVPVTKSKVKQAFIDISKQSVGQALSDSDSAKAVVKDLLTIRALPEGYVHH